ncbi:MAG: TauD/TfdA family dioxygenase [Pseudomonadota bacterium]
MIKPEVEVNSVSEMTLGEWELLVQMMNRHGCAHLVQSGNPDGPVESLRSLGNRFGKPVYHKLSDDYGIHPIRYIPGFPEYANANFEDLGLHTDGSFEDDPPVFMMIYCETPAEDGGDSTLASGDVLYTHLHQNNPEYLDALCKPAAFKISRDDRTASRSVFLAIGDRYRLAYRSGSDVRLEVDPGAAEAFEYVRNWLLDPENYFVFKLRPGEILIFDNTRMLHGRTGFSPDAHRSLYGLWCDGGEGRDNALLSGIDPN